METTTSAAPTTPSATAAPTPTAEEEGQQEESRRHGSYPRIVPTEMRTDPLYSLYYVNLTRFVLTGAGPIVLLAFFYYRVSINDTSLIQGQSSDTTNVRM